MGIFLLDKYSWSRRPSPQNEGLKVSKTSGQKSLTFSVKKDVQIHDSFDNIKLRWTLSSEENNDNHKEKLYFDRQNNGNGRSDTELTLSGILNFIDGLWSSCGDERIIVFTTNHKDRIDPALLRPGRMDAHINMSYCSFSGFKLLASSYLEIKDDHSLFGEIEGLIQKTEVTPAEVAGEFMKTDDADVALQGFVNFLRLKKGQ
ncbi:hypothetical protein Ddye_010187 [Dipteronia dyeriana]|uniref:ATPase AAA-type core domain-containing protein n=1 Tax=Dipteronia dyeriana TaxID=168575 RepID=A0AAD9XCS9_9ROSI|nr:hypothetical protein Ddye_010187 [Dipteronia dyeriana]